jgi:hypothetical protein
LGPRIGVWKCKEKPCRKQFTVRVGTVFEHGRIPLHKMLKATYLLCCSKKGISSHQLHRILQVTYKTAWFLSHRIREAMRDSKLGPLGGAGKIVEVDETPYGRLEGAPKYLGRQYGGFVWKNVWAKTHAEARRFGCGDSLASQLGGGIEDGTDDLVVAGAPAEVASEPTARLSLRRIRIAAAPPGMW